MSRTAFWALLANQAHGTRTLWSPGVYFADDQSGFLYHLAPGFSNVQRHMSIVGRLAYRRQLARPRALFHDGVDLLMADGNRNLFRIERTGGANTVSGEVIWLGKVPGSYQHRYAWPRTGVPYYHDQNQEFGFIDGYDPPTLRFQGNSGLRECADLTADATYAYSLHGRNVHRIDASSKVLPPARLPTTDLGAFPAGIVTPSGLAFDGVNLVTTDTDDSTIWRCTRTNPTTAVQVLNPDHTFAGHASMTYVAGG